jgi:hypothetical protein
MLTILFDGIAYGMLLFILAVGLSVTMGLMNFINLAHGAFAMAGGYITVLLMQRLEVPALAGCALPLVRKLLAFNLRGIVYQKLLPTLHPNIARMPGLEIMLNTPSVQKYILESREGELLDIIRKSHSEGMIDFTSSLVKLVEQEYVSQKVALEATPKPEELKMKLKGIA